MSIRLSTPRPRMMSDSLEPGAWMMNFPQHHEEFKHQHREGDDETEIKRRHQPAAVEDQAFESGLDALEFCIRQIGIRLFGHRDPAPYLSSSRAAFTPPFSWR